MNYIIRKSISDSPQRSVELLQGGYIFRLNNILVEKEDMNGETIVSHQCDEYWFDSLYSIDEIELITGKLNDEQLLYIVDSLIRVSDIPIDSGISIPIILEPIVDIETLKANKILEFDAILNEFTMLISRAKIISGESDNLNVVITAIKSVKDQTLININSITEISDMIKFSFKIEDIQQLKDMLNPYLY